MPDTADVVTRHKLSVDDYYRMADAGILGPTDRVELIDGEIIDMAPIGLEHHATVDVLAEKLILACVGLARVSVQNPVRIDGRNEPQPDFAVSKLPAERYRRERAGPEDLLLLVEVSDSSLQFDRSVKLPLYARAGIVEVWIVDLQRRVLEAHRRPAEGIYTEVVTFQPGETVAPAAIPGISLTLTGVFD